MQYLTPLKYITPFFAALLLVACGQPEAVFTDELSVRDALEKIENAEFSAHLINHTEASDSKFNRDVSLEWISTHAVGDSSYGAAWNVTDVYSQDGDSLRLWSHLWANSISRIGGDSVLTSNDYDPQNGSGENGIPNYYAAKTLPAMLGDTAWWANQVGDSLVRVVWEHVMPTRSQAEQFILTTTDIQDPESEDYHPETTGSQRWVFEAPHGLPVQHENAWYRGEMAYGTVMTIDWEWTTINDAGVELAVANWIAPQWGKEPEPETAEVAGGGGENWFEEAMATLPALDSEAPALTGLDLAGEPVSLEGLRGQLVYLDFWYIGCGPCMRALPHLAGMQEEFGPEGFTVLGVNQHQSAKTVQRYLDRRELVVPQMLLDSLPETYPVVAYPTWFLLGRDGQIIERDMGYSEDTGAFLDSLVQANL